MEMLSNLLAINQVITEGPDLTYWQLVLYVFSTISALCIAMPVHEFAHAYVAYKQGDPTAKVMGRMSLAPHVHFDIWGFLCLYIFGFGWAKPVPVDERNFKNGRRSNVMVSLAGIVANLLTGIFFIIVATALNTFAPNFYIDWGLYGYALSAFLNTVITFNFVLAFFNLLPIYPLDGFRVIQAYCKPNNGFVNFMRTYSNWILIAIVVFGGIIDLYLTYTAGYTINGLFWVFEKFWGLFV